MKLMRILPPILRFSEPHSFLGSNMGVKKLRYGS